MTLYFLCLSDKYTIIIIKHMIYTACTLIKSMLLALETRRRNRQHTELMTNKRQIYVTCCILSDDQARMWTSSHVNHGFSITCFSFFAFNFYVSCLPLFGRGHNNFCKSFRNKIKHTVSKMIFPNPLTCIITVWKVLAHCRSSLFIPSVLKWCSILNTIICLEIQQGFGLWTNITKASCIS